MKIDVLSSVLTWWWMLSSNFFLAVVFAHRLVCLQGVSRIRSHLLEAGDCMRGAALIPSVLDAGRAVVRMLSFVLRLRLSAHAVFLGSFPLLFRYYFVPPALTLAMEREISYPLKATMRVREAKHINGECTVSGASFKLGSRRGFLQLDTVSLFVVGWHLVARQGRPVARTSE